MFFLGVLIPCECGRICRLLRACQHDRRSQASPHYSTPMTPIGSLSRPLLPLLFPQNALAAKPRFRATPPTSTVRHQSLFRRTPATKEPPFVDPLDAQFAKLTKCVSDIFSGIPTNSLLLDESDQRQKWSDAVPKRNALHSSRVPPTSCGRNALRQL